MAHEMLFGGWCGNVIKTGSYDSRCRFNFVLICYVLYGYALCIAVLCHKVLSQINILLFDVKPSLLG